MMLSKCCDNSEERAKDAVAVITKEKRHHQYGDALGEGMVPKSTEEHFFAPYLNICTPV